MTPAQLSRTALHTLRRALGAGTDANVLPGRVVVEAPPRRGGGDYATGVALQVAARTGRPPRDVAELLRKGLAAEPGVADVRVVGPGFVNVTLDHAARAALVRDLAAAGSSGDARDRPAADIARWAAATGEDPAALAVRTARSSSLFRVQYAYARTRAVLRNGRQLGIAPDPDGRPEEGAALLALLADQARVEDTHAAGPLARHLAAVADAFLDFHDSCPPLPSGDEKPGAAHRGRLALAEATGAVLAGGLSRLGVSAPAHI
ncbi:DALR anticodon-binding domain-containing protein [Streptomyces albiaxialis]|uniref:arginine--tRNA ligase n=1 Tax=Streptomyces albiaxialis TaxID=329523 RepID=A0ABN2VSR6_9ACTN